jgi:hypothetical protein
MADYDLWMHARTDQGARHRRIADRFFVVNTAIVAKTLQQKLKPRGRSIVSGPTETTYTH